MHTLSYLPGTSSDILSAMYPHLLQGKVTCPNDAVHVVDNVAYIDQEKCTGCGICAEKCPKKIITGKKVTA